MDVQQARRHHARLRGGLVEFEPAAQVGVVGAHVAAQQAQRRRASDVGRCEPARALSDAPQRGTLGALDFRISVTQQYIVGEFSSLLAELQPAPAGQIAAVHDLRREVESSPLPVLSQFAHTALDLSDVICLAALEEGDVNGFRRYARIAVALGEFTANAGLLP